VDGTPQDGNVFLRQAESRPQLGVIDVDEPWICSQVAKKARLVCEYGRCWPTGAGYESSEPAIFTAIRRASSRKN